MPRRKLFKDIPENPQGLIRRPTAMETLSVTGRTQIPDIIPQLLQDALPAQFAGRKALWGTGAVIANPNLPTVDSAGRPIKGGQTLTFPYFEAFGELDDLANDGDALTPAQLTTTGETENILHSGKAFELAMFAQNAALWADPYAEAARQFATLSMRRMDAALITAAAATTLTNDVYNASVPVTLNYDVFVDSRMKFKDEQENIALIIVHSKVLGDLYKLKDSMGRPLLIESARAGELPTFLGIPVATSDRLPNSLSPIKYTSLLVKRGALGLWYNGNPEPQLFKDVLKDDQIVAIHLYFAAHLYKRIDGATQPGVVAIKTN